MEGGLTGMSGVHSGFSTLSTLIFQWVPGIVISLSALGSGVSGVSGGTPSGAAGTIGAAGGTAGSSAGPITSAVTLPQVQAYLQNASVPDAYNQFITTWGLFAAASIFISLILASILTYCIIRLFQVREFERKRFDAVSATISAHDVPRTQLRWDRITSEINSDNEQHWRLAILEADIMLNELLDTLGYRGETMADKMRTVERADFNSIDLAWEAHRARNRIAHESSEVPISAREARRVIDLYTKVFREFQFVA